ncbi:Uncharacterised protein [Mycobacteroides abscessus subsp. abscessus]|nr:Uncharacterised protein [Mycobacteroides abscessus subsp. abscessus]
MQQREGVRSGPPGGHTVAALCLQIGCRFEAREISRTGAGHCREFVSASRSHLYERSVSGRRHHAGGGGGDGAVVIQDRQDQGLQDDAFGEGATQGEYGGPGEVELALGVAVDIAAESVGGQVLERIFVQKSRH